MEEIIIRSLHGRASPEEERSLVRWRKASSDHEEQYRDLEWLWSLIRHRELAIVSVPPAPVDIVRQSAVDIEKEGRARGGWARGGERRGLRRALSFWALTTAAAVVTLAVGISQLSTNKTSSAMPNASDPEHVELTTGTGELATLRLPDGSVVRLAPESHLRFSRLPAVRDVWLDGRAFFAVAEQEDAPFRVRSRGGEALVLGTRFDIRVEEDDLHVLVVEGRVALYSGEERAEVEAGQMSRVTRGNELAVVEIDPLEMRRRLEWMRQFIVFQDTPLDRFAREFEQHYGIPVRILDESLVQRTVTGWFTVQPAEDVLMMICYAADVRCSIRDGVATIEP